MNTLLSLTIGEQIEHVIPPQEFATQVFYLLLIGGLLTTLAVLLAVFRHKLTARYIPSQFTPQTVLSGLGLTIAGTIVCTAVFYGITAGMQHVMRDTDTLYSGDQLAEDIEQNLYDNYAIHAATVDVSEPSTDGLTTFPAKILPFDSQRVVHADVYYNENYDLMTIISEDYELPIPPRPDSAAYYAFGSSIEGEQGAEPEVE